MRLYHVAINQRYWSRDTNVVKESSLDIGKLDRTLIHQISEAYSTFLRYMDLRSNSPLRSLGLSQWRALNLIHFNPGCTQSAVATHLDINRASASSIIDLLVKKSLVERQAAKRRSAYSLLMTKAGETEIKSFYGEMQKMEKDIESTLGAEKNAQVIAILKELTAALVSKT